MKKIILLLIIVCSIVPACSSINGKILILDDASSISKKTDVDDPPTMKIKSNDFEEVKPQDAASLFYASRRRFIDVFYGTVTTLDDEVTASSGQSVSRIVQFRPSALYGIRVGTWLESNPYIGLAGDVSYLQANAPGVSIWYVPLSFVMMGRYPFLRTDTVPDGRFHLYGGVMASLIIGDMEVDINENHQTIGGSASGYGFGALFGIAWNLGSYALFGEFRFLKDHLKAEETGLFGGDLSASADLESRQLLFGVSYKY